MAKKVGSDTERIIVSNEMADVLIMLNNALGHIGVPFEKIWFKHTDIEKLNNVENGKWVVARNMTSGTIYIGVRNDECLEEKAPKVDWFITTGSLSVVEDKLWHYREGILGYKLTVKAAMGGQSVSNSFNQEW